MLCSTIKRDDKFIEGSMAILQQFYLKHIIPELLTRKLENRDPEQPPANNQSSEKKYCYCQTKENDNDEEMIGCDAIACPWEWFHLSCVNLKQAPRSKGKWYCPSCRKEKAKEKKRERSNACKDVNAEKRKKQ